MAVSCSKIITQWNGYYRQPIQTQHSNALSNSTIADPI